MANYNERCLHFNLFLADFVFLKKSYYIRMHCALTVQALGLWDFALAEFYNNVYFKHQI